MQKFIDQAKDWAAMSVPDARAMLRGEGKIDMLREYVKIETRESLLKIANTKIEQYDAMSARAADNAPARRKRRKATDDAPVVVEAPPIEPPIEPSVVAVTTEAAFVKVAERTKRRAKKIGAEAAIAETVDDTLTAIEAVADPTPVPPEPEPVTVAPKRRKKAPPLDVAPIPLPVRATRGGFTAAEIAAAVEKYGAEVPCTRCGHTGPLVEDFGLRRVSEKTVLRQPQCRKCRNLAAKSPRKRR